MLPSTVQMLHSNFGNDTLLQENTDFQSFKETKL